MICSVLDCVTQCSQSAAHLYENSYRSNRLGLSHWDPYTVHRDGCLRLYYCNIVEWFWWDSTSSLISTTNWFPSALWHGWFGHLACKNHPRNDLECVEWNAKPLHYYSVLICESPNIALTDVSVFVSIAVHLYHSTFCRHYASVNLVSTCMFGRFLYSA